MVLIILPYFLFWRCLFLYGEAGWSNWGWG